MIRIFMVGFSSNKGGVETYILNLCNSLDADEFEVIYNLPTMKIGNREWTRPKNRHNYIRYYKFWKEFFGENYFDVLYYNTCDVVSLDMVRFAKKAGIRIRIVHAHSSGIQQELSLLHKLSEKFNKANIHRYATHLFACSKSAGDWMFEGRDYLLVKNGIEIAKYQYSDVIRKEIRRQENLQNKLVVGCVGRLEKVKNLPFAIELLECMLNHDEEVVLVLLGAGSLETELKELVNIKGMQKKVRFLGARSDVDRWMSVLDCLIMPSFFEGLPFVLIEAQATGLPCVVSERVSKEADITGLVEFVSLDTKKEVWARKIIEIAKKPRKETSQQLIEKGYSIHNTAQKVSSILQESMKDKEV